MAVERVLTLRELNRALLARQLLLELPVELVLPTHGSPTDRPDLERALS